MTWTAYLTALAWLWGALAILGTVSSWRSKNFDACNKNIAAGIPAWAWLIARYLL